MNRTVEDYDSVAKQEMIKSKQEKAIMFVPFSGHSQPAMQIGDPT